MLFPISVQVAQVPLNVGGKCYWKVFFENQSIGKSPSRLGSNPAVSCRGCCNRYYLPVCAQTDKRSWNVDIICRRTKRQSMTQPKLNDFELHDSDDRPNLKDVDALESDAEPETVNSVEVKMKRLGSDPPSRHYAGPFVLC